MANLKCDGCKYWSELLAETVGFTVTAMCLNPESPKYNRYTHTGCKHYCEGEPVDLVARIKQGDEDE